MPRGVGESGVSLAEWCAQTTLMDVLAGRKTGGLTTGDIRVDGHPKDQATFARVAGYCEQVLLTFAAEPRLAASWCRQHRNSCRCCARAGLNFMRSYCASWCGKGVSAASRRSLAPAPSA